MFGGGGLRRGMRFERNVKVLYYPAEKRDRRFPGILEVSWIPGRVSVFLLMLSSIPPERSPEATNGRETRSLKSYATG
jgi:hypothetical protein